MANPVPIEPETTLVEASVRVERERRILILEDVEADAELVERELRESGIIFSAKRVATRDSLIQELEDCELDLILADYSLPSFDGISALAIAREICPHVPFVFVSGVIGEELAIETLKKGATDYVLKQRMSRLVPSVRRALAEAEERAECRRAEEALRRSEEKHRVLLHINNAIIGNLDRKSLFDACAQALRKVVPFDLAALVLHDPVKDVLLVNALAGACRPTELVTVGTEFPRHRSHFSYVIDERRPFIRYDLARECSFDGEQRLLKDGIRSYVTVPLIATGKPFGSLQVASRTPERYSEADADFLMGVGHQIALAVENTLAFEEIAELKARLERENTYLQEEIKIQHNVGTIVGESAAIHKVLKDIQTVASTPTTVLVYGETGTGKELVARAVHTMSPQKDKPLVKVNCAALPASLIESELFGHEKGAFTGAHSRKLGRFELADGGSIFLDEIGDLPLELQGKLLRVLQEGEFERVGGSKTISVNVRVIAATNRELENAIHEGKFRSDLYYRLNVFPIRVPALRERKEDIPVLVNHLVKKYGAKLGRPAPTVSEQAMTVFLNYDWPGNVRELENVIERATILTEGAELKLGECLLNQNTRGSESRLVQLDQHQRDYIIEVLEHTGWRVSGEQGAAKILGMKPTTLEARMKKLGIQRPRT